MDSGGHDPKRPIGFGNPPRKDEFKKGKSPNEGGRPKKKPLDFDELLIKVLETPIPNSNITIVEGMLRGAAKSSLAGDPQAFKCLISRYVDAKTDRKRSVQSDETDREWAKRVLNSDPRFFVDLKDEDLSRPKNGPSEAKIHRAKDPARTKTSER